MFEEKGRKNKEDRIKSQEFTLSGQGAEQPLNFLSFVVKT